MVGEQFPAPTKDGEEVIAVWRLDSAVPFEPSAQVIEPLLNIRLIVRGETLREE